MVDPSGRQVRHRRPWIPVQLFAGDVITPPMSVLIDSGADFATFRPDIAKALGIDMKAGREDRTLGVDGTSTVWVHDGGAIGVAVKDPRGTRAALSLDVVQFSESLPVAALLGRNSFFEMFRVTFNELDATIDLSLIGSTEDLIDWDDLPDPKKDRKAKKRNKGTEAS